MNIGLALAAEKLPGKLFVPSPMSVETPDQTDPGTRMRGVFLVTTSKRGEAANRRDARLDRNGLTFVGDAKLEPVDLWVSRAEIRRASKMALAFRLPESVGLRWLKMARPFRVDLYHMRVMPVSDWAPHKWRVTWLGNGDWAVKGSPSRSSFAWGQGLDRTERLMQDEIAAGLGALGLKAGVEPTTG